MLTYLEFGVIFNDPVAKLLNDANLPLPSAVLPAKYLHMQAALQYHLFGRSNKDQGRFVCIEEICGNEVL